MERKSQLDQGCHLMRGQERDSNEDIYREARRAEKEWREVGRRSTGTQGPATAPQRGEQISEEGYRKDPTRVAEGTNQARREEGTEREIRQPKSSMDSRRDQIRDLQERVERLQKEEVRKPRKGKMSCQDCGWHTCAGEGR